MYGSILPSVLLTLTMIVSPAMGQTSTFTASRTAAPLTTTPATFILPTNTRSPDPWQCATKNLTQYFDVPRPTAALLSALESYADVLNGPCLSTATGMDLLSCTISETSKWCGFATDAKPVIQTRYSAYGSSAASWYGARSSAIESVKVDCPITWEKFGPLDKAWLNQTIAHAKCYDQAHPKPSSSIVSVSSSSKRP
ncbi:hypothetical protein ACN47E_000218 [Coniothyrium glycines]